MHKPCVSIIVPIYNTSPYLTRCLDSIIRQTFQNIEIICINDGSTDESLEILKNYEKIDPRILILNQSNQGLSSTRNEGIKRSNGDSLMFIDSDDTIELDMVEKLYEIMSHEKSDMVIGSYKYIDQQGLIQKVKTPIDPKLSKQILFQKMLANEISSSVCICLYKKNLLLNNHLFFYENLYYEDAEFQYKALYCAKLISICNDPLYNYYYLNNGSITNIISTKHIEDLFFIFHSTETFLNNQNLYFQYESFLLLRVYNYIKYLLLKITPDHTNIKHLVIIFEKLWKSSSNSALFQKLSQSKKLHLVYLTLTHIKGTEDHDFFQYFDLSKQHIHILKKYIKSRLGLMQGVVDYLSTHPNIKEIYIYGAGDILKLILPELEKLQITVLGFIDKDNKQIVYQSRNYSSMQLENIPFNDKSVILITSLTFVDEICNNIFKHTDNCKILDFTKCLRYNYNNK